MPTETFRVEIKEHGRVNLPRKLRERLDLREGDQLLIRVTDDGHAEVVTTARAAGSIVGLYAPARGDTSLTDELIAERHVEAERE